MLTLGRLGNALTARIAATKKRLLAGGLLRPIEWGIPGEPDIRGRRVFTYFMLDALIEQRPAVDRGTFSTDRSDNTVLTIFDPVAITDQHLFKWGDPPHTYQVKAVDGLVEDETTGVRFRLRSDSPPVEIIMVILMEEFRVTRKGVTIGN